MEEIRSFIAIELPEELKKELEQLDVQLKAGKRSLAKWVKPDGIHLTLKFLGNIAAAKTGEIIMAMEEAVQAIPPFQLKIKDLGAFPNLRRIQVVWAGISGEVSRLSQLQQRLESSLARLGFAPETRPFVYHLTLARLDQRVPLEERQRLAEFIAGTGFEANHAIQVESISLMRSQLTREGAIYSRIGSVSLKTSPPDTRS